MLPTVVEDCNILLQVDTSTSSEEASQRLRPPLDKYYITSSKLSQGVLILLKKIMPSLESLLSDSSKLASTEAELERR